MPRALITTQGCRAEQHPSAAVLHQPAAHLGANACEGTGYAGFPHHPGGPGYPAGRTRRASRERREGLESKRGWHLPPEAHSAPAGALVCVSQVVGSTLLAMGARHAGVEVGYGLPLVGGHRAAAGGRAQGAKLATIVSAIYPDNAIEAAWLRRWQIVRAAKALEWLQHSLADRLRGISEGHRQTLVEQQVPAEKIGVEPAWLDESVRTRPRRGNARPHQVGNLAEKYGVLCAKAVGIACAAAWAAGAAVALRNRRDLPCGFAGRRVEKPELLQQLDGMGLDSGVPLPFQERECLPQLQARASPGLAALNRGPPRARLPAVAEAAHTLRCRSRGKPLGSKGDNVCFSCHASKALATGEGGMAVTRREARARPTRVVPLRGISRNGGQRNTKDGSWFCGILAPGCKRNLACFVAAVGGVQLARAAELLMRRQQAAACSLRALGRVGGLQVFEGRDFAEQARRLFVSKLRPRTLPVVCGPCRAAVQWPVVGTAVHCIPQQCRPAYRASFSSTPNAVHGALRCARRAAMLPGQHSALYLLKAARRAAGQGGGGGAGHRPDKPPLMPGGRQRGRPSRDGETLFGAGRASGVWR